MKPSHVILLITGLIAAGVVLYLATRPSTGDDGSDEPMMTSVGSRSASPLNIQDAVRVNLSI